MNIKKYKFAIISIVSIVTGILAWKCFENELFLAIAGIASIAAFLMPFFGSKKNNDIDEGKIVNLIKKALNEQEREKEESGRQHKEELDGVEKTKEKLIANDGYDDATKKILDEKINEINKKHFAENAKRNKKIKDLEKKLEQAEDIIKQYKEKDTKKQSPLYKKAYNHFIKGDIEKALTLLNTEDLEKHKDIDLWLLRASLLEMRGDYDKAIECYKKAIELNPDYADAYGGIGTTYCKKDCYDKAIECYKIAIELESDFADANTYNNMGIAYRKKGYRDKAIEYYEKAIELNPNYENAYHNMRIVHEYLGEEDKANDCFQKASILKHGGSLLDF